MAKILKDKKDMTLDQIWVQKELWLSLQLQWHVGILYAFKLVWAFDIFILLQTPCLGQSLCILGAHKRWREILESQDEVF